MGLDIHNPPKYSLPVRSVGLVASQSNPPARFQNRIRYREIGARQPFRPKSEASASAWIRVDPWPKSESDQQYPGFPNVDSASQKTNLRHRPTHQLRHFAQIGTR